MVSVSADSAAGRVGPSHGQTSVRSRSELRRRPKVDFMYYLREMSDLIPVAGGPRHSRRGFILGVMPLGVLAACASHPKVAASTAASGARPAGVATSSRLMTSQATTSALSSPSSSSTLATSSTSSSPRISRSSEMTSPIDVPSVESSDMTTAVPSTMPAQKFQVEHSDEEWRRLLTPGQYSVLREAGTEVPYSSALEEEGRPGLFACAGCSLTLFSSTTKFNSGTGWPSFWQAQPNSVLENADESAGLDRTGVRCRRCGGHVGHLFHDGPQPTELRYCMNGVALKFRSI